MISQPKILCSLWKYSRINLGKWIPKLKEVKAFFGIAHLKFLILILYSSIYFFSLFLPQLVVGPR